MPIGFPVDNTSVYLFDNDMRPAGLEKVSPFDNWMLPNSFTVTDITRAGFVSLIIRSYHDFICILITRWVLSTLLERTLPKGRS